MVLIYEELPVYSDWCLSGFWKGSVETESVITASAYTYIAEVVISGPESRRTLASR